MVTTVRNVTTTEHASANTATNNSEFNPMGGFVAGSLMGSWFLKGFHDSDLSVVHKKICHVMDKGLRRVKSPALKTLSVFGFAGAAIIGFGLLGAGAAYLLHEANNRSKSKFSAVT